MVDHKMPDDREEVEDEGTAPPVKSGYKPADQRKPIAKAGPMQKRNAPKAMVGPAKKKGYEDDLD